MKSIGTEKIIFISVGVTTLIFIILVTVFASRDSTNSANSDTKLVTYSASETDKPKTVTSSNFSDLGDMKLNSEKSATFTITNQGNKPLQLYDIKSSCMCTFGQITIDGVKSPEFGMHSENPWIGIVAPGKKATLSVIYKPYLMPVSGTISRDVYVKTNDPSSSNLTFTVKAFVE
ncbi:DUF1573 domain-containing protein [Patescibacteria group bacterium]|nr:DUF1573 domain-containing protein [Patescibacteria group bacterium]MCL5797776.1 DUF1573 domain-containing protein [Patescibacteria group bacterium]